MGMQDHIICSLGHWLRDLQVQMLRSQSRGNRSTHAGVRVVRVCHEIGHAGIHYAAGKGGVQVLRRHTDSRHSQPTYGVRPMDEMPLIKLALQCGGCHMPGHPCRVDA